MMPMLCMNDVCCFDSNFKNGDADYYTVQMEWLMVILMLFENTDNIRYNCDSRGGLIQGTISHLAGEGP